MVVEARFMYEVQNENVWLIDYFFEIVISGKYNIYCYEEELVILNRSHLNIFQPKGF